VTATANTAGGRFPALAAPIACGCCLLAGAAYVTMADPGEGGLFLPCPFRTLTGWWCPGCGLTRATHHLFRGDLVQALRFNIFVVLVLGGLAGAWLAWTLRLAGKPLRQVRVPGFVYAACATVLVGFAIVRNLPGVPGLRG
jgi:hypothetical protein